MTLRTLTIVGVGLIGGSVALAARQRGVARRVLGVGRNSQTLEQAVQRGILDAYHLDLPWAVAQADLTVFCTPVDQIPAQILAVADVCPVGALLTDAGSTKAAILAAVEGRLPAGVHFVGSHPLAGSEKRGHEHADANLFHGRLTVVTHTPRTDPDALERVSDFWRALGSRVKVMTPQDHDAALALTSHLPHLTAAALAGILPPELHELTATGFRDTTRVAAGDPSIWTGILVQNRAALLDGLGRLMTRLARFREALQAGDTAALDTLLRQAKEVRDALGSDALPQG
jgi:prephenate dehydrogenase